MKKAFIPGTFDPPTLGHLDIIQRAAALFDHVTIGVTDNLRKAPPILSIEERIECLKLITATTPHLHMIHFSGLVIEVVKKGKFDVIIRGIRSAADLHYENDMAVANRHMCGVETLFLMTDPLYSHISSSLVKEIASYGHRLNGFVPEAIEEKVFQRMKGKR